MYALDNLWVIVFGHVLVTPPSLKNENEKNAFFHLGKKKIQKTYRGQFLIKCLFFLIYSSPKTKYTLFLQFFVKNKKQHFLKNFTCILKGVSWPIFDKIFSILYIVMLKHQTN